MLPPCSEPPHHLDFLDQTYSWHPFTQMSEYLQHPRLHIEKGKGCWLYDTKGRSYFDLNASLWTNIHGHNDPQLRQAILEQLDKVAHTTYLGLSHPGAARLNKVLCDASGLDRVFYSDNGSSSVEIALKLSLQYWQLTGEKNRREIIGFANAYHGDTFGAMSLGDSGIFHQAFKPWFFPVHRVPTPHEVGEVEALEALKTLLNRRSDKIAALILEPCLQGAAGFHFQPIGFVKQVSKLCDEAGVHLILDEVFTAFGRLGRVFACSLEGVLPHFLCLAKGLSAGLLPLGATLTRQSIYEAFLGTYKDYKAFFHGHTFTANPLAVAVALASFEKLKELIETRQLEKNVHAFHQLFEDLAKEAPPGFTFRHMGLAGAVDLPTGKVEERRGFHLCLLARQHRLLLRALGDTLPIVPPIVTQPREYDFIKQALLATFRHFVSIS